MRRPSTLAFVLVVLAAGSLCLAGSLVKRSGSFSLGVVPSTPVLELRPDATLCQGPIDAVDAFDRVALKIGTFMRPGQPLDVLVRDARTRAALARGSLPGGYADNREQTVAVGRVGASRLIRVCVTNRGSRRIVAYGSGSAAHVPSRATIDGKARDADPALRFLRDRPRSLLELAPAMVQRATLFGPSWLAPWMLWSLLAAVTLAVAGLLSVALVRAAQPSGTPAAPAQQQAGAPVDA